MIVRALPERVDDPPERCGADRTGRAVVRPGRAVEGKAHGPALTFLAPGANALDTDQTSRASGWMNCSKTFPPGVTYDIPYDTTRFIEVSIKEVDQDACAMR